MIHVFYEYRATFGQALLAILVSVIGYILHRHGERVEVIMNGRTDKLMTRVEQLEVELAKHGAPIPPSPPLLAAPLEKSA